MAVGLIEGDIGIGDQLAVHQQIDVCGDDKGVIEGFPAGGRFAQQADLARGADGNAGGVGNVGADGGRDQLTIDLEILDRGAAVGIGEVAVNDGRRATLTDAEGTDDLAIGAGQVGKANHRSRLGEIGDHDAEILFGAEEVVELTALQCDSGANGLSHPRCGLDGLLGGERQHARSGTRPKKHKNQDCTRNDHRSALSQFSATCGDARRCKRR